MAQALFEVPFDPISRQPVLPRKDTGEFTLFNGSTACGWSLVTNVVNTPKTVLIRVESSVTILKALAANPNILYIIGVYNGMVLDEVLTVAQAQAVGDWAVAQGWPESSTMDALRACTTRLGLLTTIASLIHIRPIEQLKMMGGRQVRQFYSALAIAPHDVSKLGLSFVGRFKKLAAIGAYDLWQVIGEEEDLIAMHQELYATAPLSTLGLLAVLQTSDTFYPTAVKIALNMTDAERIARRNRIAAYLTSIGKSGTAVLAATNEHELIAGIVTGMGYTLNQLWAAMI